MTVTIDRKIYFDKIKASKLFGSEMTQDQVDGQEAIIGQWEKGPAIMNPDLRWLAYPLATTAHETGMEMQPIEEYGKGEGMSYGKKDPETGQTYYGRGYVQLTWRDNYRRATEELGLAGEYDLEWNASKALDPQIAADTMFRGMQQGWFRSKDGKPETLERHFSATVDDPYGARNIINGDQSTVPSWSNGVSIGNLIKGYHEKFLSALKAASTEAVTPPQPAPGPIPPTIPATIDIKVSGNVTVTINGKVVTTSGV